MTKHFMYQSKQSPTWELLPKSTELPSMPNAYNFKPELAGHVTQDPNTAKISSRDAYAYMVHLADQQC